MSLVTNVHIFGPCLRYLIASRHLPAFLLAVAWATARLKCVVAAVLSFFFFFCFFETIVTTDVGRRGCHHVKHCSVLFLFLFFLMTRGYHCLFFCCSVDRSHAVNAI